MMPKPRSRLRLVRRYFFTGLVVLAPVGVTIGVLVWGFRILDGILGRQLWDWIPGDRSYPGLGLLLLLISIVGIGWVVEQAAGRQLLYWWNQALARFPLTGRLYSAASQIVQTVVGERKRVFQRPVAIPYPTEGMWAVAFVTSQQSPMFSQLLKEPCVNVFVPTTPNPTSGFMLVVPENKTIPLDISIEEAIKLIISAGAVDARTGTGEFRIRGLDLENLLRDTSEQNPK
jgi:uncharacterized membrane protein